MGAWRDRRESRTSGLVWGLILIGLGVCFLLMMTGVLPDDWMQAWWPLFVIAAGLGNLACARDPKSFGSGVTVTGIGVWLMVASNNWYGLGWNRSWPLVLVAAGLGSLSESLARIWWRKEEDVHVG